jgi:hypothetical protein
MGFVDNNVVEEREVFRGSILVQKTRETSLDAGGALVFVVRRRSKALKAGDISEGVSRSMRGDILYAFEEITR